MFYKWMMNLPVNVLVKHVSAEILFTGTFSHCMQLVDTLKKGFTEDVMEIRTWADDDTVTRMLEWKSPLWS